ARRRLRVVLTILLAGLVVGVAAVLGALSWTWLAAPAVVLVAWLVACRRMVRRERAAGVPARRLPLIVEEPAPVDDEADPVTAEIVAVEVDAEVEVEVETAPETASTPDPTPAPSASTDWDPVPVTLPTYVGKEPAARRSVRTIDLDDTGVWTSGRTAADSKIAREADAERAERTKKQDEKRRASGS
ncbi:MAG: hypothetical protein Q7T52_16385, partial [Nocardioides sp.]|nr:hypothetical protein [Nocardioides sp.]